VQRVLQGRLFRRRVYDAARLEADLAGHALALRTGSGVLGRSPRTLVTHVDGGAPATGARIVKQFAARGPLSAVRQRLGLARARGAWVGARALEVDDIATPPALALLEASDGSAVLVTRALPGAASLRDVAARLAARPQVVCGPAAAERAAVARATGFLVGRLARAGWRHADLSAKNLLVTAEAPSPARDQRNRPPVAPPSVWLIDLDGLRRMPAHDARGLARMLGQLGDVPPGVTRTDRLRFRHGYAAAARRDIPPHVVHAAARQTLQRVRRRERLSRPAPHAPASI
jgi:hypothetical protein